MSFFFFLFNVTSTSELCVPKYLTLKSNLAMPVLKISCIYLLPLTSGSFKNSATAKKIRAGATDRERIDENPELRWVNRTPPVTLVSLREVM